MKRIPSLILALLLLLSLSPAALAGAEPDTEAAEAAAETITAEVPSNEELPEEDAAAETFEPEDALSEEISEETSDSADTRAEATEDTAADHLVEAENTASEEPVSEESAVNPDDGSTPASGDCGSNAAWILSADGVLTITGSGEINDFRRYFSPWYTFADSVKSVIISDGITGIGSYAFADCTALATVSLPDSLTAVDRYAFSNCTSLTALYLPASVTDIPGISSGYTYSPFYGCSSLTIYCESAAAPSGWIAGWNCNRPVCYGYSREEYEYWITLDKSAEQIVIPDYITFIPKNAFYDCADLTEITFGIGITTVGDYAFWGAYALTRVNIGSQEQWDTITFGQHCSNPLDLGAALYINNVQVNTGGAGLGVAGHTQAEIIAYYNAIGGENTLYRPTVYTSEPTAETLGTLSAKTIDAALATLNFVRYVAGLRYDVTVTDELNEKAQAASFVNSLNGILDHTPSRPDGISDELYTLGYNAAGCSNLCMGRQTLGATIIDGYMRDAGESNLQCLGHRRWCLDPRMTATGFGMVKNNISTFSAMISFTPDVGSTAYTESNIAWPAANMPVELFPYADEAWSLSLDCILDPDTTSVTLTRINDGRVWHFSSDSDNCDGYFTVNNLGYGLPGCVIFVPDDVGSYSAGDQFSVVVSSAAGIVKYTVSFFSLSGGEGHSGTSGITHSGTGWAQDSGTGNWYYFVNSVMFTDGWKKIDGTWYRFNTDGTMYASRWYGNYYLTASGAMATGWCRIDGSWYYFNTSGTKQTGWIRSGTTWYYLGTDGTMYTDRWCGNFYLTSSGAMAVGWHSIDGSWYYFNTSGAMQTGWIRSGSTWYYLGTDGAMYASRWYENYYLTSSGAMAAGWCCIDGIWYYFSTSGAMQTGWIRSGGSWYYMDPNNNGIMVSGTTLNIGGTDYTFNAGGRWVG